MIVVSNASPLLALAQADSLPILKTLFGHILVPEAVRLEVVDRCPVRDQRSRIEVAMTDFIVVAWHARRRSFSRNLGRGEQGVIELALERGAQLLLMDDRKARNEARELGLQCAFTTDVLRLAEQRGIIASATEIISSLRGARIFLPVDNRQPGAPESGS